MPVIRISDKTYELLQSVAVPLGTKNPHRPDTPEKVLALIMQHVLTCSRAKAEIKQWKSIG